ncbi:MAG TPA: exodeoxyribonuclease VII large subunit [Mycobacteriales bacterium]|nr:exodeoxyribonuclease VII large subunit [Mycobacteriales bacterium]
MALESSAEAPLPVRTVALALTRWVARLGRVWVEGQVTDLSRRPGAGTAFLTLRDPVADVSLRVTCPRGRLDELDPPLSDGARVVIWAKPEVYPARGTLALLAYDIRPVGIGELLARLERLKRILAAEGLFTAERKRPLPFLPGTIGLITGRGGAAEHDVVENARRRWPAVRFRVENVAVQGPHAVGEMVGALRILDRDPAVDVIVLARGGGSVEDLLAFSDETLCRAVADCRTPVVSAVGHEADTPLVDLVADRRASTPTDAGKLLVPDVAEENHRLQALRDRGRRALGTRLEREAQRVHALRERPVLARPGELLDRWAEQIAALVDRSRRCAAGAVEAAGADVAQARIRVTALSPAATLARGYAIVQTVAGDVVRDAGEVALGDPLRARLANGGLDLVVTGAGP